jgi:hypothetical protein
MSDDTLLNWMDALVAYAKDWDRTFGKKEYFTQEYWYLFVSCYRAHLCNRPLTISEALGEMKTGAPNTRKERMQNAIDDGYLEQHENEKDKRSSFVVPTDKLSIILEQHFKRTRSIALNALVSKSAD